MAPLPESHSPLISPILRTPHTDAESPEDDTEARMRQALGKLGTAGPGRPEAPRRVTSYQAKPGAGRHRFRQDGEVPVVRISLAEEGRGRERPAHAPAGSVGTRHGQAGEGRDQGGGEGARELQELTEQLRATQTRLGHAELALAEAGREARARQEEAAELRQALNTAEATLAQLRAELAASKQAREGLERRREATRHSSPRADERDGAVIRRRVGRPLGSTNRVCNQAPTGEAAPVKWWAGD